MKRAFCFLSLVAFVAIARHALAQEAVMEEVRVEGSFSSSLELPNDRAVDIFTRRLSERAEAKHEFELQLANRSTLTTLLSLTSAMPIPLGSSENRIDTFSLQNYMRVDLNPSTGNSLFDSKVRNRR